MTVFYCTILKAINDYKAMLRRSLVAAECSTKIRKLNIKRACIKNVDEVELYEIGLKIIDELELDVVAFSKYEKSVNFYYGAEGFLQYLKKLLSEYTIDDGRVVNVAQKSSCALVSAIQLISKAKEGLTDEIAQQVYRCARIIAKHGNKEQKEIFNRTINSNQAQQMSFFFRQLQDFVSCLDEQ